MTPGHNWMNNPVTRKRYHMLAMAKARGHDLKVWRNAIMSGSMDAFELV